MSFFRVLLSCVALAASGVGTVNSATKLPPPSAVKEAKLAKELWSATIEGGKPVAVFFDAASDAIFVSVDASKSTLWDERLSRLDKYSLTGKLIKKNFATVKESDPGPITAHAGKLFWVAGGRTVLEVDDLGKARPVTGIPDLVRAFEIMVNSSGHLFLIHEGSQLFKVTEGRAEKLLEAKKIRGAALFADRIFLNIDGKLVSVASGGKELKQEGTTSDQCFGLQRTSEGRWFCASETALLSEGKALLTLKKGAHFHPAYVNQVDAAQDFVVVPFYEEGTIRAYRLPAAARRKKTEK